MRPHCRIGIEMDHPSLRCNRFHRIQISGIVDPLQMLAGCERRGYVHQVIQQSGRQKMILDGIEPRGTFWMMGTHVVQGALSMMNVSSGHCACRRR
jgi:hypothetical protein